MEKMIQLTHQQLTLAFAASCIEAVAHRLGVTPKEIARRMGRVHLVEDYILPFYEQLHTESRDHVTDNIIECLQRREEANP